MFPGDVMPDAKESIPLMLLAAAILAVGVGLPAVIIFFRNRSSLFPLPAAWRVPWNGWAVLIAFALALLLPALVQFILTESGFFGALYGPEFPQKLTAVEGSDQTRQQAAHLRGLWSQTIALPILIILLIAGLRIGTRATLPQMGLGTERFGCNLALGYFGWLALAPLCYGLFMLAIAVLVPNPQRHPLMDLGPMAGNREWIVFGVQAGLFAPFLEELLFRGVLLAWLLQPQDPENFDPDALLRPEYRPHIAFGAALMLSLQPLPALAPFIFALALAPLYLLLPLSNWLRRWTGLASPQAVQAWFASALLFASVHASVWPSPIPLFVLGLGLGWLAIRTRSIVPCIIAHALFNGVAVVYVAIGGPM
jgi:membrane protease YdiL (CAAX protease family)